MSPNTGAKKQTVWPVVATTSELFCTGIMPACEETFTFTMASSAPQIEVQEDALGQDGSYSLAARSTGAGNFLTNSFLPPRATILCETQKHADTQDAEQCEQNSSLVRNASFGVHIRLAVQYCAQSKFLMRIQAARCTGAHPKPMCNEIEYNGICKAAHRCKSKQGQDMDSWWSQDKPKNDAIQKEH
eukprot:4821931-Pleurochrysis_carterae.AAC.2